MRKLLRSIVAAAAALLLSSCATTERHAEGAQAWNDAAQLVLVVTPNWNADHGTLRRYERDGAGWRQVGEEVPVTVGRAGAAWGLGLSPAQSQGPQKREGDGRSPAGVFAIGDAFGYAPRAASGLPYLPMSATHYCVDVSGAPNYNRIVDAAVAGQAAVEGSTEPMRRDIHADGDQRYRLGFVIEHNPKAVPMGGSCIFAHLWKSPSDATSGCTAMAPETMEALLPWLRRDRAPVFVLLPAAELARLAGAWGLPRN